MNEFIITFLASFLIWIMFAGILLFWVIDGKIKKEVALHAFLAAVTAWLLAEMVKSLIPSLRPFRVSQGEPLTLTVPEGHAFPSSHTAVAFGMSVSIWLHNKKIGIIYLISALLVGVGRILANVHYPLDIIGGASLGSILALVTETLHIPYFNNKNRKG